MRNLRTPYLATFSTTRRLKVRKQITLYFTCRHFYFSDGDGPSTTHPRSSTQPSPPPSSTGPPPTQRPTPSLPTDSSPATSTPAAPLPPPSPPLFPLPASVYSPPSTRPEGPGYQDPPARSEFSRALNSYDGPPGCQAPPPTPRAGSPLPEGVISSHQVP